MRPTAIPGTWRKPRVQGSGSIRWGAAHWWPKGHPRPVCGYWNSKKAAATIWKNVPEDYPQCSACTKWKEDGI